MCIHKVDTQAEQSTFHQELNAWGISIFYGYIFEQDHIDFREDPHWP